MIYNLKEMLMDDAFVMPVAEQCPNCGGVLTTNQDGWKVCHTCGYSSPGVAPEPVRAAAGRVLVTV